MKRKTSERGSKHKVAPLEETKDAKTSRGDSESGSKLQIPKLKIPELVNSPKNEKPMRNYIPQTKRMLKTLAEKAAAALELDNAHFVISREKYEAFLAKLDEPTKGKPNLRRLITGKSIFDE